MSHATHDTDHETLLRAIGQALGHDEPYQEHLDDPRDEAFHSRTGSLPASRGHGLRVRGGAIDEATGRVAWVEERVEPPAANGHVPVYLHLRIAREDDLDAWLTVQTYNPFFGCRVSQMRWHGEALVCIYSEKHRTLLAHVEPPYIRQTLLALPHSHATDGDDLYTLSGPGLLTGRRLSTLQPLVPLLVPRDPDLAHLTLRAPGELGLVRWPTYDAKHALSHDQRIAQAHAAALPVPLPPPDSRPLPADTAPLRRALLAAVEPGAPRGAAELLVDTVSRPFLRDRMPRASTYDEAVERLPDASYLVAHHVLHLRTSNRQGEADTWLQWLDRIAPVGPRRGWPAGTQILDVALTHLRLRAGVLASIARTGTTPPGESCQLFRDGGPPAADIADQPAPVLQLIETLRKHSPRKLGDTPRYKRT